jgi:uncharacterized membrane protein YdjX (TVP38/TMEM64 family)
MTSRTVFRVALLLFALAAIGAAFYFFPVGDYLTAFAERVRDLGPWGPVLLAAVYVVAAVLFIPGGLMTLVAGFLFGIAVGTITASLASIAGASVAFGLGRGVAHDWVQRKLAGNPRFRGIDEAVNRQAFRFVLLIRLSPVFPYVFTNYVLSLTNIRFRDFFWASWIGMLPGTVLYVYLGSTAQNLAELTTGAYRGGTAQTILFVMGLLATVMVTVFVTRAARSAVGRL